MIVRLVCPCGASARANVERDQLPPGIDPVACALNVAAKQGWRYRGGRVGKSVVTVECPWCRPEALRLEADYFPADVVPATFREDLAPEPEDAQVGGQGEIT